MTQCLGVRPQNQGQRSTYCRQRCCIMTQYGTGCLAAVLVSLYITFSLPGGTNGCTDHVSLTSSISGRNACLSEEVTFTCTARGDVIFWGNEAFEETTMHYTSAPSILKDKFRAEIVSYDGNQSCLVSSLSFQATALCNGSTVTCTSRNRTSIQSLSLHIMSNIDLENITLKDLTVVPDSSTSVQLEWKVTPTDGHYCIRNYNIQIAGPNGSQWGEEIPGSNQSFRFTGLQLMHLQNYTCCVTANLYHTQIASIKQTITVELQEPHPPTNISAEIQCKQGYEIQIDWQPPLPTPFAAPLTGYLLQYHVHDNSTSIIELPLNTSYILDSVPSGALYTITVSALSDVGPSTNNPSVQLAVPSSTCEGSLAAQSSVATQISPATQSSAATQISLATQSSATQSSVATQNTSESTESVDDGSSSPLNSITTVITATSSGVGAFTCILLLAGICLCIMLRKRTLKKESKVSKHVAAVSKQEKQGPRYEEISLKGPHYEEISVQNNHVYHTLEPPA